MAIDCDMGRGTCVRIYLPTSGGPSAARARPEPAPALSGHETVLIVDDEPMILRVAQTALERLGYRVLSASDGLDGLEVATGSNARIDLLITDVVMPRLGGRELAGRLQALGSGLKVLYTSGYAENAIAHHGVLLDGVHFLQKPYALATLARRVREILDE
jgi:CheY-like chemotaxis protein